MTENIFQPADARTATEPVSVSNFVALGRSQLFSRFVDFWLLLCGLSWIFSQIFAPEIRTGISLMLVCALLTKLAMRSGRTQQAKYLLVGTWTLFLLFAPASVNGIVTPLVVFMLPYLILVFWLFGMQIGFTIVSTLTLIAAVYWAIPIPTWYNFPRIFHSPISWMVSWLASLACTYCVWYLFRHYEELLQLQGDLQHQTQLALQRSSQAHHELESMYAFNQAILYLSPLPMAVFEAGGACLQVNDAYAKLIGISRKELQHRHNFNQWENSKIGEACRETIITGLPQVRTLHEPSLFGKDLWLDCKVLPINIDHKKHVLLQLVDLTERTKAENALRNNEKAFRTLVDTVSSSIVMKNSCGHYLLANAAYQKLLCIPESDMLGKTAADILPEELAQTIAMKERRVLASAQPEIYEETLGKIDCSGERHFTTTISPLVDEVGEVYGFCSVSTDITDRKVFEEELRQLAFHDALTRLPNRRLLLDRLAQAVKHSRRTNELMAVLFIDLNRFKELNDTYGHQIGDLLLVEVAERLKSVSRKTDTVARLGGDEFVILLEALDHKPEKAANLAAKFAEKVDELLTNEYILNDIHYTASASIGVKVVNDADHDPDQILKDADAAMYLIKKGSRLAH